MNKLYMVVALLLSLAACTNLSGPITNQQSNVLSRIAPVGSPEAADLLSAAKNANGLVSIGVLEANDPIVSCANGAVKAAGLDVPAQDVKSYTPELNGPASEAVILYVQLKKAREAANRSFVVPAGCGDLLLKIKIDAIRDNIKILKLL